MRIRTRMLAAGILFSLVAAGCEPVTPTSPALPTGTVPPRPAVVTLGMAVPYYPNCSSSSLAAPTPLSPRNSMVVDSLNPTLSWDYSGPGCSALNFLIEMYLQTEGYGTATTTIVPGSARALVISSPLKPGTAYVWRVRAMKGKDLSPLETAPGDLGSGLVMFFTPP